MTKELDVHCPCCSSRLSIDVRTAKVMRWQSKEELDAEGRHKPSEKAWDSIEGRVQNRMDSALDQFDANLAREERRTRDLDALFEQANEKLKDRQEDDD